MPDSSPQKTPSSNPALPSQGETCKLPRGIEKAQTAVLELRVRNHPGTMSHITGLFARRAFNLEAIVCVPLGDGSESRMLLLVADEPRLEQVEKQLLKLHDIIALRHRTDLKPDFFARLATQEVWDSN